MDSKLTFKSHISKMSCLTNFNIHNFREIRPSLTTGAALLFLHTMIFSHFEYCITSWSYASAEALKPIKSLFKRALKALDRKPLTYHYCKILPKYSLLSFENFVSFKTACLTYKILHGLPPPPLEEFIKLNTTRVTRATTRGDYAIPHESNTFAFFLFLFWPIFL